MSINLLCECGQKLTAKDELVGKRVKCPKCGVPLTVHAAKTSPQGEPTDQGNSRLAGLLDEAGVARSTRREASCPECKAEMLSDDVVCTECGYSKRLGRRVTSRRDIRPEDDMSLPPELRKAMRQVRHEKIDKIAETGEGYTSWMVGLVLFATAAGLVAGGLYYVSIGGCQ